MIIAARPGFDPDIFPIKRKTPIVGKADCRPWDLVPVWVIVQYRYFLVHQLVPDAGFYVTAFQTFRYWSERKRQHEATIMQPNPQQTLRCPKKLAWDCLKNKSFTRVAATEIKEKMWLLVQLLRMLHFAKNFVTFPAQHAFMERDSGS